MFDRQGPTENSDSQTYKQEVLQQRQQQEQEQQGKQQTGMNLIYSYI